jgi:hypothetical protein
MKSLVRFACLSFVLYGSLQLFHATLNAQGRFGDRNDQPRNGVCFYTDENFGGDRYCAEAGESRRNVEERFNDRFSSLRVFGRARVVVYEDENFGGARTTFTSDIRNLRNWNDRITSFEVTGGGGFFGGGSSDRGNGGWGGPFDRGNGPSNRSNEPRNGACFYMDEDYRGDSFCVNSGEQLRNVGDRFNDRISSIRVFGRARVTVYENENFSGASRSYNHDIPNLGNFNDKTTSLEIR